MKILLRRLGDEYYVWKTADWENDNYYITVDGKKQRIAQINILAVKEDDRGQYVTCAFCGAKIENNPESIEKHFAEREAKRNCFACEHMTTYGNDKNESVQFTKNEDGTYHMTRIADTNLGCTFQYWRNPKNIDSEEAKNGCQYCRCRIDGVKEISDLFVQHPDVFGKQLTVDLLIKNGYKCMGWWNNTHGFAYDMGLRGGVLIACVNELGIVDHFIVRHRYNSYIAYYSERYDKLFFDIGSKYSENIDFGYEISKAKYDSAKKKIAELYKEVK